MGAAMREHPFYLQHLYAEKGLPNRAAPYKAIVTTSQYII